MHQAPLVNAAEEGNLGKVKILLSKGENINQVASYKFGWTPLTAAIFHGHWDVAHFLLQVGADPNVGDKRGETPLMWATGDDSDEAVLMIRDLIAHGADPNAKDAEGASVLSYASAAPPKPKILQVIKSAIQRPKGKDVGNKQ